MHFLNISLHWRSFLWYIPPQFLVLAAKNLRSAVLWIALKRNIKLDRLGSLPTKICCDLAVATQWPNGSQTAASLRLRSSLSRSLFALMWRIGRAKQVQVPSTGIWVRAFGAHREIVVNVASVRQCAFGLLRLQFSRLQSILASSASPWIPLAAPLWGQLSSGKKGNTAH